MEATQRFKEQIQKVEEKIAKSQTLLKESPELKELVEDEIEQLERQKKALEQSVEQIRRGYVSTRKGGERGANQEDPESSVDALMEIRSAAGGDEAGLFAADLYRMYLRFAESQGWKAHQISMSEGGIGNINEVIFELKGNPDNPVYPVLKHESGVHRVQRVPETESSGRIHTSTATVAVLPKIKPKQIKIDSNDLKIDTFRSSGPGGQSVNKTESAVRVTHLPTGTSVSVQDEKSQHKNREKALDILSSRLYEMLKEQQKEKVDQLREERVGRGQRSEKIRTYNFPQNRVTDHRVNQSWHNLSKILDGELDEIMKVVGESMKNQ